MYGCLTCQDRMLDHLYDLLDEAERADFLTHLQGCPVCQAGLEKVRAQQKRLAAAARRSFPDVVFAPPSPGAAEPAPGPRPVLLPLRPKRPGTPRPWLGWAAAAAILLAVVAAGVPAYQARHDYLAKQNAVSAQVAELRKARQAREDSEKQVAELAAARDREIDEVRRAVRAREMRLIVSGPRIVQPGAAADFQVQTFDLNGQPVDADLTAALDGVRPFPTRAEKGAKKDTEGGKDLLRPESGAGPPAAAALPGIADAKTDMKRADSPGRAELKVEPVARGVYKVRIPASLALGSNRTLAMAVSARRRDVEAKQEGGEKEVRANDLTLRGTVKLTAPVYLTHLTTDKPIYQPGEVVRFRSLTLDRVTLAPSDEPFSLRYTLTPPVGPPRVVAAGVTVLQGARGDVVNGPDGKPVQGIGAGEVVLAPGSPAGEYALTVTEDAGRFQPTTRKFLVNEYAPPRLDKKLDFNRSSYGPGDEVQAQASAKRADGGPLVNCPVEASVTVDGRETFRKALTADADGQVVVRFPLPKEIDRGVASLSVLYRDSGTPESITRPIPVVLKKVNVELFPEGGDLVAGLPSRVYLQARTPAGKPAQIEATLYENDTPTTTKVVTLSDDREQGVNQGLGVFSFTPRAGKTYSLRIDAPKGVADRKPLPKVKADGVTMRVEGGVFQPGEPIPVQVRSTRPRSLLVAAYCRETLLDAVQLEPGKTEAVLRPTSPAGGVCRVTVFEVMPTGRDQRHLEPRAERLVYRHPGKRLDVSVIAKRKQFAPGEKASLSVVTTNETERLAPAIAQVAVIDKSVLTMADERTARSLPTHFLLTTEVRRAEDLEHADFLIGQHPKAPRVLDLLLGTQGWRRFAEQKGAEQFRETIRKAGEGLSDEEQQKQTEDAERLLVMIGHSHPQQLDPDQRKIDRALERFEEKVSEAREKHDEATERLEKAASDEEYRAAVAAIAAYDRTWRFFRLVGLIVGVLLVIVWLVLALRSVATKQVTQGWLLAGAFAATAVFLCVLGLSPARLEAPGRLPDPGAVADLRVPAAPDVVVWDNEKLDGMHRRGAVPADGGSSLRGGGLGRMMPAVPAAPGGPVPPGTTTAPPSAPGIGGGFGGPARPSKTTEFMSPPPPDAAGKARPGATGIGTPGDRKPGESRLMTRDNSTDRFRRLLGDQDKAIRPLDLTPRETDRLKSFKELAKLPVRGKAKEGKEKDALARDLGADAPMPLYVREYAHARPEGLPANLRGDFAETVYWHPVLILPDGKADVSFQLPDSVTRFEVMAFAHSLDGRLGAGVSRIETRLPVSVTPKLPTEVTSTDRLRVPVAFASTIGTKQSVRLNVEQTDGLEVEVLNKQLELPPEASRRVLLNVRPTLKQGTAALTVEGGGDRVRQTVRVVPDGFPVERSSGDLLEKSVTHTLDVPGDLIPGTLKVRVDAYPSPLADLTRGLEGLLREPYGCFEQTSSSNYPNVLMLDFLRLHKKASPQLEGQAREKLERGYKRLISFECLDPVQKHRRGFEWFGGTAPPHEALTAYGLLQFHDMARVAEVDPAMVARTRQFLMDRRDGSGGFQRNDKASGGFGRASKAVTDAYIVWALTETGKEDVSAELDAVAKTASASKDAYLLSLAALALANRDRAKEAEALLARVAEAQAKDGSLSAETSITRSGGVDLKIETTALAVLGWLKVAPARFTKNTALAVRWIAQQRQGGGGFGSTQSTILALKALIAHTQHSPRAVQAGELKVFIGEKQVAIKPVTAGAEGTIMVEVPTPEEVLKAGANRVRVEMTPASNVMPHTLGWSYRAVKPAADGPPLVKLTTRLSKTDVREGETVRLTIRVENVTGSDQGMATAIVGLPAGLSLPENLEQLRAHCKLPADGSAPLVSAFEASGRELVLYWRGLEKGQAVEVPLDLIARVPGTYRGPASRAYLYYNARTKHWVDPLAVTIAAE